MTYIFESGLAHHIEGVDGNISSHSFVLYAESGICL